jgi:hypothetical protein
LDKLQHIDTLLKKASQVPANALVNDSDWKAVERKLRYRKFRIYAMWIFLTLISASITLGSLYNFDTPNDSSLSQNTNETTIPSDNIITNEDNTQNTTVETPITEPTIINDITTTNTTVQEPNNPVIQPWTEYIPRLEIQEGIDDIPAIETVTGTSENISPLESIQIPRLFASSQLYMGNLVLSDIESLDLRTPASTDKKADKTKKSGKSPNNKGHIEVGLAFTPSISSKTISENSALAGLINKEYYNFVGNNEGASFSSSYGINLQYHAPKDFFIATGLFVSQRTESIKYDYVITDYPDLSADQKSITSYPKLQSAAYDTIKHSGSNSYHFIEVPINLGYKTKISPNFELRSQVGISYLQLLQREGKKGDYTDLSLKDVNQLDLNTHNVAANMKIGVYYNTSRFAIGLEPTAGMNINSLSSKSNSAIQTKPYSYGINLTTNFKLIRK